MLSASSLLETFRRIRQTSHPKSQSRGRAQQWLRLERKRRDQQRSPEEHTTSYDRNHHERSLLLLLLVLVVMGFVPPHLGKILELVVLATLEE